MSATSASTSADVACAICTDAITECAKPDCCSHLFCYKCILRWTQTSSTCPLCKAQVHALTRIGQDKRPTSVIPCRQEAEYDDAELEGLATAHAEIDEDAGSARSWESDDDEEEEEDDVNAEPSRWTTRGYRKDGFVASDNESISYEDDAWQYESEESEATYEDEENEACIDLDKK